jgi:hypothetical protein
LSKKNIAAAILAMVALSACGGASTPEEGVVETPVPVESVEPTPEPTPEPSPLSFVDMLVNTDERILSPVSFDGTVTEAIGEGRAQVEVDNGGATIVLYEGPPVSAGDRVSFDGVFMGFDAGTSIPLIDAAYPGRSSFVIQ